MVNPRIALLIIGDGRSELRERMLASFIEHAEDYIPVVTVEVDDTEHRLGFCGAIREGWARLRKERGFGFVMHLEEDFEFLAPFSIGGMARILDADRSLAQVALKRGPHGDEPPGGFMAAWPKSYAQRTDYSGGAWLAQDYLIHSLFFTTNPSLYPARLLDWEWPPAPACERAFTEILLANGARFAYLGRRDDDPLVLHTGTTRTGTGY